MLYLAGAALALLLSGGFGAAFFFGYRLGRRLPGETEPDPATSEQQRREERLKQDFEILSGYSLARALQRKRV